MDPESPSVSQASEQLSLVQSPALVHSGEVGGKEDDSDDCCAICLGTLEGLQPFPNAECPHYFCSECLSQLHQHLEGTAVHCPVCRRPSSLATNGDRCTTCLRWCTMTIIFLIVFVIVRIQMNGARRGGCVSYYRPLTPVSRHRCQLAATVQMWDCGCENATGLAFTVSTNGSSLLRTLGGADGSPPDGAVSRTVRAWLGGVHGWNATDVPEPRSAVSLGGIDAMYPWLNPTCADIGVHNGSAYCSNDPDFLLRRNTTSSPIPSQVPRDCVTWNDGCDTCGIVAAGGLGGDETMACGAWSAWSAACENYDVPFCSEYADGRVCGSSRAPGCDPQTKPGSIDHTDPELQRVLLDMVTSWYDQCPSASAATCTPTESRVECVVWAHPIDCLVVAGRPFLDAHQALQASARVEVGSDWIGASP